MAKAANCISICDVVKLCNIKSFKYTPLPVILIEQYSLTRTENYLEINIENYCARNKVGSIGGLDKLVQ